MPAASSLSSSKRQRKTVSILSFDGGGTRGVMEVVCLDAIFKMATLLVQTPQKMPRVEELLNSVIDRPGPPASDDESNRSDGATSKASSKANHSKVDKKEVDKEEEEEKARGKAGRWILELLEAEVAEPIHPTEVFDMIVGTSTGGMIAMLLLAGVEGKDGRRERMSIKGVEGIYLETSKFIFGKTAWSWLSPPGFMSIFKTVLPYDHGNLEIILKSQFGDACLKDVDSRCIGGCIAKKVGEKNEELKFFNTISISDMNIPIYKVLMATTDAPVYFNGPVQIEDTFYVDGGLGGNCPLKQAIPTALELFGDDANLLVVSLAPPSPSPGQIPTGVMQQIVYWLQYFPSQVTSGGLIYNELKSDFSYGRVSQFYRMVPSGKKLNEFGMDELNIKSMIKATEAYIVGSGLFDILLMVFGVVSEILARQMEANYKMQQKGIKGFPAIYEWMLTNGLKLVELLKRSEVEEKLENIKTLLKSVEKMMDIANSEEVKRDLASEGRVFQHLGVTSLMMADQVEARRCFDHLFQNIALRKESNTNDNNNNNNSETLAVIQIDEVEALLLFGDSQFESGSFDHGTEEKREALWYYKQALNLLENVQRESGATAAGEKRFLRLSISAKLKIGRAYLKMGDYSRALSKFQQPSLKHDRERMVDVNSRQPTADRKLEEKVVKSEKDEEGENDEEIEKDEESEVDNSAKVDKNENDLVQKSSVQVVNLAEKNGEEDNWFVADQATTCIEEVEVVYDIGVCSYARKAFDVAKKAFSSVINYLEDNANSEEVKNYPLGPVLAANCRGFIKIIEGDSLSAIPAFKEALPHIVKMFGGNRPHLLTAMVLHNLGVAAFHSGGYGHSLRFFVRAVRMVEMVDDDGSHPVIGTSKSTMGVIFTIQTDFEKARQCFSEARKQFLQIHDEVLAEGNTTEELIEIRSNEACVDFAEKRYSEAQAGFAECLQMLRKLSFPSKFLEQTLEKNLESAKSKETDETTESLPEHFILV